MEDKRIEDMLRDSCKPDMPQGMRDRVLRAARQELAHQRKPRVALRWRPLLAGLAVAIVLLTNIMDHRTQAHLTALTDGSPSIRQNVPSDLHEILRQRRMDLLMAVAPTGPNLKGDDSL